MAILSCQVANSSDDAFIEYNGSPINVYLVNTFLGAGLSSDLRESAMIFRNLNIPKGSIINNAYITFQPYITNAQTICNLKFIAEASSNPNPLSTNADYLSRSYGTLQVNWNNVSTFTLGNNINTPDITSIVQEVINRNDWSSGGGINILVKDNGSDSLARRNWDSYDNSPSTAPILTIDYTPPGNKNVVLAALPGYNALTDTNLDHFSLYSDVDNVLIKRLLADTQNITDGNPTIYTRAHNLDYIPFFMAFADKLNNGVWTPINNQYNLFSVPDVIAGIDTSNLNIQNFGGHSGGSLHVAFDIFYDNMNDNTAPAITESQNLFKVGRPNVNVLTSKNPNDYIMHSDLNNFKILKQGLVTNLTIPSSTNTVSFAHGANVQAPFKFFIFIQDYATKGDNYAFLVGDAVALDWLAGYGITVTMDATNINLHTWSTTSNQVVEVAYIIYGTGKDNTIVESNPQIAIAAPGKNALNDTNPDNYNFHSSYPTLKYFASGQYSMTVSTNTVITIPHNLGYVPFVVGFVNDLAGIITNGYAICPYYWGRSSLANPTRDIAAFVYADANNIYLKAYFQPNAVGTSTTFNFQYKIFKNNLGL